MKKIPVGILGYRGIVGEQYCKLLENHPQFEIKLLATSKDLENLDHSMCELLFSALPPEHAEKYEERFAQEGARIISSAAFHRTASDVPLIIPEINATHLNLIPIQQKNRKFERGFIITKPNCTLQSFLLPLYPLHQKFGIAKLLVTTLQALSGAGRKAAQTINITDNVIPYISGEEEKLESEPLKILGTFSEDHIDLPQELTISAHCNRVAVSDGHLATISVSFHQKPSQDEILNSWSTFQGLNLHSFSVCISLSQCVSLSQCLFVYLSVCGV